MQHITVDPDAVKPPYRPSPHDQGQGQFPIATKPALPEPTTLKVHPDDKDIVANNAQLYFVGNATTIFEWDGIRIMTDPNFLHAGDHVHLGPGVTGTRVTNPAVNIYDLPRIDLVLLSHYHADHFDQLVEDVLRRDLPIITTPHAHHALTSKTPSSENFTEVTPLDTWSSCLVHISPSGSTSGAKKCVKVTAMPGKHVPPGPFGLLEKLNELAAAVPPTNGWMVELGEETESGEDVNMGYRIYISGDTLFVDDLKDIPVKYPHVDLMLIHLGGTTLPGPSVPLLMVTMDALQGIQLVHLIQPDVTIPIHYDDYDVFLSPLKDFQEQMTKAGLDKKVVYLDRGEGYKFAVKSSHR